MCADYTLCLVLVQTGNPSRVFAGDLPAAADEDLVNSLFAKFGGVAGIRLLAPRG
jgi:hypothetical protein